MLPSGKVKPVAVYSDATKAWGELLRPYSNQIIKMYESSYSTDFDKYQFVWLDEDFKTFVISTKMPIIGHSIREETTDFTIAGYGNKFKLVHIEYEATPEERSIDLIRSSILPIKSLMKYWGL